MKIISKIREIIFSYNNREIELLDAEALYKPNKFTGSVGVVECSKGHENLLQVLNAIEHKGINKERSQIIGIWPYCRIAGANKPWSFKSYIRSYLMDYAYYIRWKKFYKIIGVSEVKFGDGGFSIKNLFLIYEAYKLFKKIQYQNSIKELEYKKIKIGDLIYSSYIRYSESFKINYRDLFLFFLIYQSLKTIEVTLKFIEKNTVDFYITGFTSYIEHGVPTRVFLSKGVTVYSFGNNRMLAKKHQQDDFSHKLRHWDYPRLLMEHAHMGNIELLRKQAVSLMESRLNGEIDPAIFYMKSSPYSKNKDNIEIPKLSGVVYLHDFFDSAYDYRSSLFEDLFSWADFTLDFISRNRLNIGVKPHPNQISEGQEVVNFLKRKYEGVYWIDPSVSNSNLIRNTHCGISVFGSILVELAYAQKPSIAAGDHPGASFNISYMPKSIGEYEDLLRNVDRLTAFPLAKEEAIDFYVAHNLLVSEDCVDLRDCRQSLL